jgi:hypothetical protein
MLFREKITDNFFATYYIQTLNEKPSHCDGFSFWHSICLSINFRARGLCPLDPCQRADLPFGIPIQIHQNPARGFDENGIKKQNSS